MTTAPWWGVPVIAGGFLIIGGLLTFLYTYFNERRKFKNENRRYWSDEILRLYLEFVKVVNVYTLREVTYVPNSEAIDIPGPMLAKRSELDELGQHLFLLADRRMQGLIIKITRGCWLIQASVGNEKMSLTDSISQVQEHVEALEDAVRKRLDIPDK